MPLSFIFGEGTNTPDAATLQRRRQMVDQLQQASMSRAPQTFGEGLTAIGQALASRIKDRDLSKKEAAERERAGGRFGEIASGLMGGQPQMTPFMPGGGAAQPRDPMAPQSIADDAMVSIGREPTNPAGAIRAGLIQRGMPEHIADAFIMNMQDESGLRTDINERNPIVPGSRGGFGLAQWTGPRRRALEAFAAERGVPVSDKNLQLDFLMQELQGPEARAGQRIMSAQDTPTAAAAILNDFLRPAEQHRAEREARYMGGQQQGGMAQSITELAELASNPYLPEGQRMVAQMLIQQQMQQPKQPDPTSGMREYELARSQGFQGSFLDYQQQLAEARRSQTNVTTNVGGEQGPRLIGNEGLIAIPDATVEGGFRFEVAPNSPAALEREASGEQARFGRDQLVRSGGAAIQDIGRALDLMGEDRILPIAGGMSRIVAGVGPFVGNYDASSLRQMVRSAQSSISINEIMNLRRAGGTLGAIPYQQQQSFERLLGELDADGDPQVLQQNLQRVHNMFWEMVDPDGAYRPEPFDLPFDESGFRRDRVQSEPVRTPPPVGAPSPAQGEIMQMDMDGLLSLDIDGMTDAQVRQYNERMRVLLDGG